MAQKHHGHDHGEMSDVRLPGSVRRALALALSPLLVATAIGLVALWPAHSRPQTTSNLGPAAVLYDAKVDVLTPPSSASCNQGQQCYSAGIVLTSGPQRGHHVQLDYLVVGPGNPTLHVGDRIVVGDYVDPSNGTDNYSFSDFKRTTPLVWLVILFVVLVVAVARWRGLAALAGLGVTAAVLLRFVVPAILEGESPVAVSLVGGALIMIAVLYLAHGVNGRTTIALLGTLGTLAVTAALAAVFVAATHLTGGATDESVYVQVLNSKVNLSGLLLGGIVIGSLGVLNDVTVTQASAVWEIHIANPSRGVVALWRSGMRVGRDHIASVVYTLVLAYAGASLPLLLIFSTSQLSVGNVLTSEIVAEELVRGLVGSIGLVASVPVTTALAAFVVTRSTSAGTASPPGEAGTLDG
jgi:uncharacterized membrane protein